jgi:AP endonuclease-2
VSFKPSTVKADGRPANYGSRIDLILCTAGLRPWIKGGDIQNKVYGSDHCPVYIDLHDSIELDGERIHIRDLLNPADRPPSTGTVFPWDEPRSAPQPPRFATKFMEEFSTKQRTLKSLWANAKPKVKAAEKKAEEKSRVEPEPGPPTEERPSLEPSTTMGIARAAFEALDAPQSAASTPPVDEARSTQPPAAATAPTQPIQESSSPRGSDRLAEVKRPQPATVDLTLEDSPPTKKVALERSKSAPAPKGKAKKAPAGGQAKLAAFWSMPKPKSKAKESTPPRLPPASAASSSRKAATPDISLVDEAEPPDTVQDELLAQALAEEDEELEAERARQREARNQAAGTKWASMFAPKKAPLCTVHQHPCKDFSR